MVCFCLSVYGIANTNSIEAFYLDVASFGCRFLLRTRISQKVCAQGWVDVAGVSGRSSTMMVNHKGTQPLELATEAAGRRQLLTSALALKASLFFELPRIH